MSAKPLAELTGVGVGPGEPGLLTMEGARVLAEADVVFAPAPRTGGNSLAALIAAGSGLDKRKVVELPFPMTRDGAELERSWTEAAKPVVEAMEAGKKAAFATLGDPSLYSTWIYLRRAVERQRPGTKIVVVPGIMAANAAAARLGVPLAEGDERFLLLPMPDPAADLDAFLPLVDRLAVYKIGARLPELAGWVEERGLADGAMLVSGAGLPRERAGRLTELGTEANGYLSVALIGTRRGGRGAGEGKR